jgi:hypothetical protein
MVVTLTDAKSISRAQLLELVESLGLDPNTTGSIQLGPDSILVQHWHEDTRSTSWQHIEVEA